MILNEKEKWLKKLAGPKNPQKAVKARFFKIKSSKKRIKEITCHNWALLEANENGWFCRICRLRMGKCAYHVWPKQYGLSVELYKPNVVWACIECNNNERFQRARYVYKHEEIFGKERMQDIRSREKMILKISMDTLREMMKKSRQECAIQGIANYW